MIIYSYPARTAATTNAKKLREEIVALSLPGFDDFSRDLSDVLHVHFDDDLTTLQKTALDTAIANHDHTQLTAAQQAATDASVAEAAAEAADADDRAQLAAIDSQLSTYISTANVDLTNAIVMNTLRLVCRVMRYMIRRGIRKGWL